MDTATFLDTRPVFTLTEALGTLGKGNHRPAVMERLRYYTRQGRVKPIAYGVYASVPAGMEPANFQPDRYLAAAALRPDGVISHHSALELLGAAHSDWNVCTVVTRRRRMPVALDSVAIRFIAPPLALMRSRNEDLGVRSLERLGRMLHVTGPERTLVDGFHQPALVGGLAELVESAAGFGVLDLELLRSLLEAYDQRGLWAAVGWFLARFRRTFFVPDDYLAELERHRPRSAIYAMRAQRGGVRMSRWNLIVPESVARLGEPDEP